MMPRYRDGLLAFALLTVSGVIAVAIAVDPKGFSIREWQQLLAAFVALGAATLAYQAAMAKVEMDRKRDRVDIVNRRLGLLLRLEQSVSKVAQHIGAILYFYDEAKTEGDLLRYKVLTPGELYPGPFPDEISEAWSNLEMLPTDAILPLCILKEALPKLIEATSRFDPNKNWQIGPQRFPDFDLIRYMDSCRTIAKACETIRSELDRRIDEYQQTAAF